MFFTLTGTFMVRADLKTVTRR